MSPMVPNARPLQPPTETARILAEAGVQASVCLLGVRGYYRRTMGDPSRNDRGIYDDAIFLHGTNGTHIAFTANVDPSVSRPGIATLCSGLWSYRLGIHGLSRPKAQQYTALVQAAPVTVRRDPSRPGGNPTSDTGFFGINIHRGSATTTSSIGCQTIHPSQWDAFIASVKDQLARAGQKQIPYLLTDV